jgi:DNA-binding NtrC family response regulator
MRSLFDKAGYVCTATGTSAEARELIERKFFPVALVDLDIERAGIGLDVARVIREQSKPTSVILLTRRRSFEAAVEALRLGVIDVVVKQPDQIEYLKRVVAIGCDRASADGEGEGALLREAHAVLDDAFRTMLDMGRKMYADVSIASGASFRPRILVVESDQELLRELAPLLQDKPWEIAAEMNGGGALDKAGSQRFDLVVCRSNLMDLRGSMVIKTVQAERAELLGVVYTKPGADGHIDVYREGRIDETDRPFTKVSQLVNKLEILVESLSSTQRDRRVIQAFRSDNAPFFRRYAELRQRLNRLFE